MALFPAIQKGILAENSRASDEVLATFAVVRHDGVAEGEDPEEEVGVGVALLHLGEQVLVVELEGGLVEPVLGEVHALRVL